MKKLLKIYGAAWLLGFVVFNVITFVTAACLNAAVRFTYPAFWIGYAFALVGFIGQFACSMIFFKDEKQKKLFLRIPLYQTGLTALAVSVLIASVLMAIPVVPAWAAAVVCLLVLTYYVIACLKADFAGEVVSEADDKTKDETSFMRASVVIAEGILGQAEGEEEIAIVKPVVEAFKYGELRSHISLARLEGQIEGTLRALRADIVSHDADSARADAAELIRLIDERNQKSKLCK